MLISEGNNGLVVVFYKVGELSSSRPESARWHRQCSQLAPGLSLAPQPTSCSTLPPASSAPTCPSTCYEQWAPTPGRPGLGTASSTACPVLDSSATRVRVPVLATSRSAWSKATGPHDVSGRKGHPSTPSRGDIISLFGI